MMLHPSYTDLMKVANSGVEIGEEPVVNSRYSIVLATAKRARQIIGGEEPMIDNPSNKKPLSIAVEEVYNSKVTIVGEESEEEEVTLDTQGELNLANASSLEEVEDEPFTLVSWKNDTTSFYMFYKMMWYCFSY